MSDARARLTTSLADRYQIERELGSGGMATVYLAAAVQTTSAFRVSDRKTLFQATEFDAAQPHSNYDVSPDGKEFVMVRRNPSSHIVVIQNLPELMWRSQRQGSR